MIFCLSYSVQSTKGTVLRPKQNTQVSSPNEIPPLWNACCLWACKWNTLLNPLRRDIQYHSPLRCCAEMNPGRAATESFVGHIRFSPVQVVGGAEKSSWMRSLLWGNQCKQCYQAACRRKCPSPAEQSNLGSPSRWYFRLLDAGLCSFCESRILRRSRPDERVFLHTHLNNFIASSAGLRKEH